MVKTYSKEIDAIWSRVDKLTPGTYDHCDAKGIIEVVIKRLDKGENRVCVKRNGEWHVNEYLKKAILLYFKLFHAQIINGGADMVYCDKIPPKFTDAELSWFVKENIRTVPGGYVRKGAYIGKNVVLMPCFVNIGAYIGNNTLVDTWASIGSCAQIGSNCHISGGAGIGGVLEPISQKPVIIEDNCFIGARSQVVEGVVIGEGSVIGMGVYIGASTKIIDRSTKEVSYGYIPPYSVVVPGFCSTDQADSEDGLQIGTTCAIITKKVDASTRKKTSINDLLR